MASTAQLAALQHWLQHHGGHLHPHVALHHDPSAGVHCRAHAVLDADTTVCTVPHSLALSSLNALVDDDFTAFRNRGLAVEAIGHFYLMRQYLEGDRSFWKPYIDTLPGPDAEHRTPFYFTDDDLPWLEDTDVLHTMRARQKIQRGHYEQGLAMLQAAKVDTAQYTWELFMWAVTIFTSRSFSSYSLRPQDSKYWAAYKSAAGGGQRQTVLLDMSRTSAEDLDFPVLFPVIDILNHSHSAKVHWAYDPGRFSLTLLEGAVAGAELFNNYGPKRNDELLLGYGFCVANDAHDKALLTLKPPPEELHPDIRQVQPGYFDSSGAWSSEKATFGLPYTSLDPSQPERIFHDLPEPLLEILLYFLRHERNLPFSFIDQPLRYLTATDSLGRQYLPHIARMIVQSLLPKLATLQSSTPTTTPQNQKQEQARIYRDGQIRILNSITLSLRTYLRALLYPSSPTGPMILTLEGLLQVLHHRSTNGPSHVDAFLTGISACAGTSQIDQLREAGWEDDTFVLLICWVHVLCQISPRKPLPEYLSLPPAAIDGEMAEQATSAFELVATARETVAGDAAAAATAAPSFWHDPRWSERFIADVGGRLLKYESFAMMVPTMDDEGEESGDVRLVYYLHG